MAVPLSDIWKLAFALVLVATIVTSACARAPSRSAPPGELRRLVISALGLYAIGGLAALTHHSALAALVSGAGIGTAALAAWLSRGHDPEDPPGGDDPVEEPPPPDPDGVPRLDWDAFERAFREYARRQRPPSPAGRDQLVD